MPCLLPLEGVWDTIWKHHMIVYNSIGYGHAWNVGMNLTVLSMYVHYVSCIGNSAHDVVHWR